MNWVRTVVQASTVLALASCHTFSGDYPRSTSLIPAGKLNVFAHYQVAYADIVQIAGVAALAVALTDPAAPNWQIIETRLPDNRILYDLRMKAYHTGGLGEAPMILAHRAQTLVREQGMASYRILRYEESLDSRIFLPSRSAYAEVQLLPAATEGVAGD